ncbi:MAG TPA: acyl-protein synthetase [Polyangiaceae bacterium]|nr:acyl-protein synthetase [Polyangiaceae bacterium]
MSFDIDTSDALHARVRGEIARGASLEDPSTRALALDVARFQFDHVAPVRRLFEARGIAPSAIERIDDIPAMPTDVFKLRRVAAHPPELDRRVFRTSGTTVGARGAHPFRTLATYEAAALAWGKKMLLAPPLDRAFVLAPRFADAPESSLGFMIELFVRELGLPHETFVDGAAVDAAAIERAARAARERGERVVVFGTAFAYVYALDALAGRRLALPEGSRALLTGGFKGRTREVPEGELRTAIGGVFDLPATHVVGEYGMTELSSQFYESTLADDHAPPWVYAEPPWARVVPVDASTLEPVKDGDAGIARIEDLLNVDSAFAVLTADRVRRVAGGFELLGRAPGAPPRGCSIALDEMLS